MHDFDQPASPWVTRFAPLIRPGGTVLDLACGCGRNARMLARRGWPVLAIDRNRAALDSLHGEDGITTLLADLENAPWPCSDRSFDAIVVCRYLHRPLFPLILDSLAEDGVLIYETFMQGQEKFGRPSNPDFLLQPDELLHAFSPALQVVAFEQGVVSEPTPQFLQRICARRPAG
ncbi:tellurite methyltransferase [mine drainage metagenome]|uniref:Tellurite methyltransferase n=1 Tax=mine drainage metagenome TaxID=410659 RepID=A0A1J5RJI1_9ZZZZ